jgi:selenocysteine-specific elongation factor
MIVGTAGHIDHGKTALVRALTGVDADRLPEEKARGITLDLGFAYWPRPMGRSWLHRRPGPREAGAQHAAGATSIDLVHSWWRRWRHHAADPRASRHLDTRPVAGPCKLTKADLADEARQRRCCRNHGTLAGTCLSRADVIPVSAVTGEGIAALGERLDGLCRATATRAADGRFRLRSTGLLRWSALEPS